MWEGRFIRSSNIWLDNILFWKLINRVWFESWRFELLFCLSVMKYLFFGLFCMYSLYVMRQPKESIFLSSSCKENCFCTGELWCMCAKCSGSMGHNRQVPEEPTPPTQICPHWKWALPKIQEKSRACPFVAIIRPGIFSEKAEEGGFQGTL